MNHTIVKSNKNIITWFFILIIVTSFDIILDENLKMEAVYSLVKMYDEIFVAFFFVYTFFHHRNRRNKQILYALIVFAFAGFLGNIFVTHSSLKVFVLGYYSTCKPIFLFWSLCQYDFSWMDISKLLGRFKLLLPVVIVSYILDFCIPTFRYDIGIVAQAEDIRMGMRSLGGLFNRFTVATLYALLFFLIYRYYSKPKKVLVFFTDFMFLSSMKIKDVLGFLMSRFLLLFKTIKKSTIFSLLGFGFVCFSIYAVLMPEHYSQYFDTDEDGNVARVVLSYTSIRILSDHMPLGVGFGTFASPISQQIESRVYSDYGIDGVYGLSYQYDNGVFMSDTFWPMIIGETGLLGTIMYLYILYLAFGSYILKFFENTGDRRYLFVSVLFVAFLFFSIGKPVFSGPPHALVLWGFAGIFYSLSKSDEYEIAEH